MNFDTTFGPLDVLCEVSGARGFDELLPHTTEVSDFDMKLHVLDLPMLIKVKAEANRPKDRMALPILMATLVDRQQHATGQLDIVIENPFFPSLPLTDSASERLYLAESVASVIEVKSDLCSQRKHITDKADEVARLRPAISASGDIVTSKNILYSSLLVIRDGPI